MRINELCIAGPGLELIDWVNTAVSIFSERKSGKRASIVNYYNTVGLRKGP